MNVPTRFVAAALLTTAMALPAMPAMAGDRDVIREGNCSGRTDWKLKASPENGRIEVEGEIDSGRAGQTWKWRLVHDGSLSAKGEAVTRGRSGSFEKRRVVVDFRGTDKLVFKARNPQTGESCRGVVNY
jgi:hypothetical protein